MKPIWYDQAKSLWRWARYKRGCDGGFGYVYGRLREELGSLGVDDVDGGVLWGAAVLSEAGKPLGFWRLAYLGARINVLDCRYMVSDGLWTFWLWSRWGVRRDDCSLLYELLGVYRDARKRLLHDWTIESALSEAVVAIDRIHSYVPEGDAKRIKAWYRKAVEAAYDGVSSRRFLSYVRSRLTC